MFNEQQPAERYLVKTLSVAGESVMTLSSDATVRCRSTVVGGITT